MAQTVSVAKFKKISNAQFRNLIGADGKHIFHQDPDSENCKKCGFYRSHGLHKAGHFVVSEGTPVYSCFPGPYPKKDPGFIMDVVDAFTIKNRGIVLTGTVELGTIDLEDVVNYRGWDLLVKGIESFHRPVKAGDNIGILIGDLGGRSVEPGEKMYLIRRNNNG